MQTLRCFVAAPISEFVRERLAEIQGQLRRTGDGRIRWEKPENLHITLKFLGDVTVTRIDALNEVLRAIADTSPAFDVRPVGFDAFPSARRPRVFYLHVDDGEGCLSALAASVEGALRTIGFPPERRPYVGHITIGRARRDARLGSVEEWLSAASPAPIGELEVEEVWLMESELTPSGAIYTPLSKSLMGQSAPKDSLGLPGGGWNWT